MIFVDTSAWYPLFVKSDEYRPVIRQWLGENRRERLVTTDYVVDELLTLIRSREPGRAEYAGIQLLSGRLVKLEFVAEADFFNAWQLFQTYRDKRWSFTDCTSRVVMERLRINKALAFDHHFRQFGTIEVLP